jgi:hypothetical protein
VEMTSVACSFSLCQLPLGCQGIPLCSLGKFSFCIENFARVSPPGSPAGLLQRPAEAERHL